MGEINKEMERLRTRRPVGWGSQLAAYAQEARDLYPEGVSDGMYDPYSPRYVCENPECSMGELEDPYNQATVDTLQLPLEIFLCRSCYKPLRVLEDAENKTA
jgi:hypothetical protein